ncbi:MAG: iron chelate uptake ABC transporter family permease subunit, partial [Phycisphaerales bacterium]|nr:iron chelate uptake ABC transporter family permease subunit [Phycisphaerales bacterium]
MGLTPRQWLGIVTLLVVVAALAILRLMIYRDPSTGSLEFAWPEESIARYRWTPLAVGMIVGSALAISGVMLQALLRNPLAEPFILGLSSGAGLGMMAAMYIAYAMHAEAWITGTRSVPAVIGGLAALAIVYVLGRRRGWLDPISLV